MPFIPELESALDASAAPVAAELGAGDPGRLTRNFHVREFASRGTPVPASLRANVARLARNLQVLRDRLGRPVRVTSGYRTPEHNRAVGGVADSQHLLAKAADLQVDGVAPRDVYCLVQSLVEAGQMEPGGLGIYRTFVHYDVRGQFVPFEGAGATRPACAPGPRAPSSPAALPAPTHSAPAAPADGLRSRIVSAAVAEWRRWNEPTRRQETDPAMRPVLIDYWSTGAGVTDAPARVRDREPWSAAFISWVMRRAGAGTEFAYSPSHAVYVVAAKRNRETGAGTFRAYRVGEAAPRPGDLVCRCRADCAATYDTVRPGLPTHCDVVVAVEPGKLTTIGGNLSDSVARTSVPTDARGFVRQAGYFAVVRAGE